MPSAVTVMPSRWAEQDELDGDGVGGGVVRAQPAEGEPQYRTHFWDDQPAKMLPSTSSTTSW